MDFFLSVMKCTFLMVMMKCFRGKNETLSHPELCLSRLESNGGRGVCGSGHPTTPTDRGGPPSFEGQSNSVLQEEIDVRLKTESNGAPQNGCAEQHFFPKDVFVKFELNYLNSTSFASK